MLEYLDTVKWEAISKSVRFADVMFTVEVREGSSFHSLLLMRCEVFSTLRWVALKRYLGSVGIETARKQSDAKREALSSTKVESNMLLKPES